MVVDENICLLSRNGYCSYAMGTIVGCSLALMVCFTGQ